MGCTSLENVTLGENIWQIYPGAFSNCPNIKYNEKDGLNYLGSEENPYLYLIGTASRDITSATIDSTCVLINSYAFLGCTLEDVFIPTSVTEIMSNAFSGCTLAGATFEKTSKWKYGLIDNISSSDLSDKSKAATCLTSTYTAKSWARY